MVVVSLTLTQMETVHQTVTITVQPILTRRMRALVAVMSLKLIQTAMVLKIVMTVVQAILTKLLRPKFSASGLGRRAW